MEREEYVEAVLRVVEAVPPGRVVSYGEVARAVGWGGPRQVGRVLAVDGGGVPWHRVVRADGSPARGHEVEALSLLRGEGVPLRADGSRVDMAAAAWAAATREAPTRASSLIVPQNAS